MKLRLYKESIRFRLRKPDVERLLGNGEVLHAVRTGPGPADILSYRIVAEGRPGAALEPEARGLTVRLPREQVHAWAGGPETGLRFQAPWGTVVLVEKDFPCMETRPDEGNEGTYERPSDEPSVCRTEG